MPVGGDNVERSVVARCGVTGRVSEWGRMEREIDEVQRDVQDMDRDDGLSGVVVWRG
jgi:hypothetical protein